MWTRIIDWLCCPLCSHFLELTPFEDSLKPVSREQLAVAETRGIAEASLRHWTEAGLLLCHACRVCFPIWRGLPVLLPYSTQSHQEFSVDFGHRLSGMSPRYEFARHKHIPGEKFVLNSFSKEWLEYDFDGVIWTANYEDYEKTFLAEVGYRLQDEACDTSK